MGGGLIGREKRYAPWQVRRTTLRLFAYLPQSIHCCACFQIFGAKFYFPVSLHNSGLQNFPYNCCHLSVELLIAMWSATPDTLH